MTDFVNLTQGTTLQGNTTAYVPYYPQYATLTSPALAYPTLDDIWQVIREEISRAFNLNVYETPSTTVEPAADGAE